MLAAIVSEASKNLSGKIFLGAWFATLAIAALTFSFSYLKASNWLNRGQEIGAIKNGRAQGQAQLSCVQRHFQGMLPSMLNSNSSDAANGEESLRNSRLGAINQRQEISADRLVLETQRNTLQNEIQNLGAAAPSQNNTSEATSQLQKEEEKEKEKKKKEEKEKKTADLVTVEQKIKERDNRLNELDKLLRILGVPKISMGEVTQLSEQDQAIQDRIYVHYDITRTFYATHQAGSVGASLALLFGSIVLIFISGDIWEGKIKSNPGLVFPLILFGSTYVLFLNLPAVLSAEEIYQANLTQYVGYVNLEEEICTVLATERFVGDSNQPGTIQAIEFNRLVHSVEQRMRALNTRTISSDVGAIDRLRLDLDALSYPRKSEQKPK
ncbi:hypothetical protein [Nodosilinea sp. FACHB-13]|uniref:hypothetical protein n=1 Tax=Cyanophyceae TaxID=3028117 RepID=UPI0016876083|nr:hypothetical protein [Nodosilinea sp. FACHB-13]MBD2106277.1 hypothetical protein [Nodosilinea sp. FACHB-13]